MYKNNHEGFNKRHTVNLQYIQKQLHCASIFTVSGKVVRYSMASLTVHKWLVRDVLFHPALYATQYW